MRRNTALARLLISVLFWLVYAPPLALLVVHARATADHHWQIVTNPYQWDYGEAPELNRALLLARGSPIYVDWSRPPYQMANYTPLYPVVVSFAVRVTGPDFLPGRLLSFAATGLSALLIGAIAWALGAPGPGILAAGLLWLAAHPVWNWGANHRVDASAVALELLGVASFAVGWVRRRRTWGVWLSVPLFVAAAYTRQTVAAGAFACYAYLLFRRPRVALGAIGAYAVLGLGLFALLEGATGGQFWRHIVDGNLNRWSVDILLFYTRPFWQLQRGIFVLGAAGLLLAALQRRPQLPALYLLAAAATALTIGKVGSNVNYFLQACAALALCAGLAVGAVARLASRYWPTAVLHAAASCALAVCAWQIGAAAGVWPAGSAVQEPYLAAPGAAERDTARLAHEHVARIPGDVLSEDMSFTVTTGRRIYVQPFEFTQLAEQGVWDQRPLLDEVRAGRFGAVVLRFDLAQDPVWHADRVNRPLIQAIQQAYTPAAVYGDYFIYVPRSS